MSSVAVLAHCRAPTASRSWRTARTSLARIELLRGPEFHDGSRSCCERARSWMPALPFREVDVLVVDEIGKNISGAGMDTNIIGRGVDVRPMAGRRSEIRVIYARGLTPESHGNAIGIGLADIVVARSGRPDGSGDHLHERDLGDDAGDRAHPDPFRDRRRVHGGRAPHVAPPTRGARIARIRNTLALDRIVLSRSLPGDAASATSRFWCRRRTGTSTPTATSTQPRTCCAGSR